MTAGVPCSFLRGHGGMHTTVEVAPDFLRIIILRRYLPQPEPDQHFMNTNNPIAYVCTQRNMWCKIYLSPTMLGSASGYETFQSRTCFRKSPTSIVRQYQGDYTGKYTAEASEMYMTGTTAAGTTSGQGHGLTRAAMGATPLGQHVPDQQTSLTQLCWRLLCAFYD